MRQVVSQVRPGSSRPSVPSGAPIYPVHVRVGIFDVNVSGVVTVPLFPSLTTRGRITDECRDARERAAGDQRQSASAQVAQLVELARSGRGSADPSPSARGRRMMTGLGDLMR